MGLIVSRFRRKKTTEEVLDNLESKIKLIEEHGAWTEQRHKRVIGHMMAYSTAIYILFAVLYYYVYSKKSTWIESVTYASPLLVLPIIILMLRRCISWYYNRKLKSDRLKLGEMRKEKRKILLDVMNTETYKVAKEILDKYGEPESNSKSLKPFVPTTNVPGTINNINPSTPPPQTNITTPGQLRQRQLALTSTPLSSYNNNMSTLHYRGPLKSEQLPRPILSSNRSAFDKIVEYLVGDGPSRRYALICKNCYSHNGMAMAEEFEYVSYKCAYCSCMNPAKKQKPLAPPLTTSFNNTPLQLTHSMLPDPRDISSASESDREKYSGSDSDEEKIRDIPSTPDKSEDEKKED